MRKVKLSSFSGILVRLNKSLRLDRLLLLGGVSIKFDLPEPKSINYS